MTYNFGNKSELNLIGVDPILVEAARFAIATTEVDFGVYEGIRTIEREKQNIANGTSRLKDPKNCLHCVQKDGLGHALDLVPYINNAYQWDWNGCYEIAKRVQQFCFLHSYPIKWGGVWDFPLIKLTTNLKHEVTAYQKRHFGKDFLDGVHFELPVANNTSDDGNEKAIIA